MHYHSIQASLLFVCQKRGPWTHLLALTPVVRRELARLALAHPGRHAAFPQQATGAFLPKGNKTCKRRIYQHISHTPGEGEAKRIHYSGSPASSLVNLYYSGMTQKQFPTFSHTLENVFNQAFPALLISHSAFPYQTCLASQGKFGAVSSAFVANC